MSLGGGGADISGKKFGAQLPAPKKKNRVQTKKDKNKINIPQHLHLT